ncbi:helix-turn-helix transcriptional regulator [Austwickia chelonae]|uniref:helix-turn-helix transcriptional regulator n=1 Tax=Austwickia chelonae TaxID=100225 RepID=UPI000E2683A9|nr:helix-turn-helix domain-containing protein [Austwickia chelonae]
MTMTTRDELLSSQVRRRIVDFVRDTPGHLAAADLGKLLGLHVTTVRFHLDQLEQAGVLRSERERRDTVGRPRKVYTLAPESIPVNEAAYVMLAEVLAEALPGGPSERARASELAGEAWARRHIPENEAQPSPGKRRSLPVREVVDVLARWGYRRETVTLETPSPGCHRMFLQHCPMREAALAHPEVVCAAHLGLIRGTFDRLGVPNVHVELSPWVTDDTCQADLTVTITELPGSSTNEMNLLPLKPAEGIPSPDLDKAVG